MSDKPVTLGDLLDALIVSGPIPPAKWGKDHRSTLLYIDTRIVDHHGFLAALRRDSPMGHLGQDPHMRCGHEYPTRLAEGKELRGHTDYDCLADAVHAGYLQIERANPNDHGLRTAAHMGMAFDHTNGEVVPEEIEGETLEWAGNCIRYSWTRRGYTMIGKLREWRAERSGNPFVFED